MKTLLLTACFKLEGCLFHFILLFRLNGLTLFGYLSQRQCEQAKLREYEEKLIVTAWYNKVK